MDANNIKIGDLVRVYLTPEMILDGEVAYIPASTGDSWHIIEHHFKNGNTDTWNHSRIHYVQLFIDMHKQEQFK